MVLFHETRPPRATTENAASAAAAAATAKDVVDAKDIDAMITDIILDKVLNDPKSPGKGNKDIGGCAIGRF